MNQNLSPNTERTTSGLAIAAFVLCFFFAPVALILGIVALVNISKSQGRLKGQAFAIIAIVWGGISVLIVPILAAVAIPAFINYTRRAKSSEATVNVEQCYNGAVAYIAENAQLPPSSDWTPSAPPCAEAYMVNPGIWDVSPWKELNFSVDMNHMYQYRFVNNGETFSCEARGDLDGDGKTSLFRRDGSISNANESAGIYRESPLE